MKLIILLSASFALACCQSCPKEGVEYYPDSTYCDRYSECREGVPSDGHQCPDGLLFNEKVTNGRNPCDYPTEVDCEGRNKKQTPQPTENCPNKWGYFSSGSRSECGYFFNCVDGRDFLFNCPAGLAFSSLTYRCEYADQSPDCDAQEYLGFSCPAEPDVNVILAQGHPTYRSSRDCREFFLCAGTSPRLQVCDLGRVFNEDIHQCDEPENSKGCEKYYPADELAAIREQKAFEAKRREDAKKSRELKRQQLG